mgnify:CR=1 FL=1
MKKLYLHYYNLLLETGSKERFEGSHCHRITPGYQGGLYEDENTIYLTQYQHALIHWLRWKLFGNFEDRKSWRMIGTGVSGLTHEDRVLTGKKCRDLGLGIHDPEVRKVLQMRGWESQIKDYEENGTKNFYYWSTPPGRSERARMGGEKGLETQRLSGDSDTFYYWSTEKGRRERARMGAKVSGKKPVTNGSITKKLVTEEEREEFLKQNPEWRRGNHWNRGSKKKSQSEM